MYSTYINIRYITVYKKILSFICKIQSLNKQKQTKNINQQNVPRLHQRPSAIFRLANSLTIEAHQLRNDKVINAFSYLFKSEEMRIS